MLERAPVVVRVVDNERHATRLHAAVARHGQAAVDADQAFRQSKAEAEQLRLEAEDQITKLENAISDKDATIN